MCWQAMCASILLRKGHSGASVEAMALSFPAMGFPEGLCATPESGAIGSDASGANADGCIHDATPLNLEIQVCRD